MDGGWLGRLLIVALGASAPVVQAQPGTWQQAWNRPTEPFRIVGNIHYVGTAGLPAYLVTGPQGHVLIDGTMDESAHRIAANVRKLGFRLQDIEYLLINHAHWDHAGGLARLKRLSGARLVAASSDRLELETGRTAWRPELDAFPPVKVDQPIGEGHQLTLGPIALTAHLTPGHTPGCTSWSMQVTEQDRPLSVLFACSLTVAGQRLVGDPDYPTAAADFEQSFARLREMKTDVFLGFHVEMFGFAEKRKRLRAGDRLAFVDPAELAAQVERHEKAFREELARQRVAVAGRP
jgi:metallo-beta-lactamase class B